MSKKKRSDPRRRRRRLIFGVYDSPTYIYSASPLHTYVSGPDGVTTQQQVFVIRFGFTLNYKSIYNCFHF